jgi:hypothetical protein
MRFEIVSIAINRELLSYSESHPIMFYFNADAGDVKDSLIEKRAGLEKIKIAEL